MARLFLTNIDLNGNELLNATIQLLAADPTGGDLYEGRIWFNTVSNTFKGYDGTAVVTLGVAGGGVDSLTVDDASIENTGTAADPVIRVKALGITNAMLAGSIALAKLATDPLARANHTGTQAAATISDFDTQVRTSRLDQMAAPTASVSLGSQKITSLGDPTTGSDAANKSYVDNLANGLAWKEAVRAATTAAGTLATDFENGDTIDGVALVTGDRILIKDQAAGAENGIYVVAASGAPSRATDADSGTDLQAATVFVDFGTVNGNTAWTQTVAGTIVVDTTALTWAQATGPGATEAGTGLSRSGSTISLSTPVSVANGGTGGADAATARTNLAATGKYATDVGDGAATAYVITHGLGTRDVVVSVHESATPWAEVIVDVEKTSTNTVTLRFAVAPTSAQYRVTVIG